MGDTGPELPPESPGKTGFLAEGAAECGALDARIPTLAGETAAGDDAGHDDGLREVVTAWPRLSGGVRQRILDLVRKGVTT
jgi:hypothetical protein